jgi:hypothetical protein
MSACERQQLMPLSDVTYVPRPPLIAKLLSSQMFRNRMYYHILLG